MASDNGGHLRLMDMMVSEVARQTALASEDAKNKAAIIGLLGELGKKNVTDDDILFEGNKIILPEAFSGRVPDAIDYLRKYHAAQEKHYEHNHTFNYRPMDGAHAFAQTMKKLFGSAGLGKNRPASMFNPERPPQMLTVPTGVDTSDQVPWGEVEFPMLDATFRLMATQDAEYGQLFHLQVDAPKKYRNQVDAFYTMLGKELKENSIYKGKPITGAPEPRFLDLSKLDPSRVVYSADVLTQLEVNLWSVIRHTDTMRSLKMPLKRSVLVEGPFGTGKTLAGTLTALEAINNGWTFILCRPGQDDLFDVLKTAVLYAPAVVWFEDIDTLAKGGSSEEISRLLDALDGAQTKGAEVVAGFTTNYVQNLQKGVLRPGRLDAVIHIGNLDAAGYRKLINNLIPKELIGEIDYQKVEESLEGFEPAFVTESINNALRAMLAANGGVATPVTTQNIVDSALALRTQHNLMIGAGEGENKPTLDSTVRAVVANVIDQTRTGVRDLEGNAGLRVDDKRKHPSSKMVDPDF